MEWFTTYVGRGGTRREDRGVERVVRELGLLFRSGRWNRSI